MSDKKINPPYDQAIATTATAISQCLTMGGVILTPKPKSTGFK